MKRRLDHDSTVAAAIVSASARMRSAALVTICKIDNAARTPHAGAIVNLLADSNECVRETALMALGKLDSVALMPYVGAIVNLLADANVHVRRTAFSALHNIDEVAVRPHASAIVGFLAYSRVSCGAGWLLKNIEAAALAPHTDAIMGLFTDPMSGFDVWQLCCMLEPTALALYTRATVDMLDNSRKRDSAIRLLASGRMGMRKPDIAIACSAVENMLNDASDDMRYWAAKALRKLKRQRARINWATARVHHPVARWYGWVWYEEACKSLYAPGGKWAERDRAAFEAEFSHLSQ